MPQIFTKLTLQNNKLKTEDFEVSGRRLPLTLIRKKMLADHGPTKVSKYDSRKNY